MPARGGGSRGGRGGRGSKPVRGGGKKFSRNLKPLDGNGEELPGMWDGPREEEEEEEDSSDEEESGSEEESSEEEEIAPQPAARDGPINFPLPSLSEPEAPQLTREQIKAAKKATKEAKIAKLKAQQQTPGGLSDNSYSDDEEKPEEIVKPKQPVAAAKGFATNNLNSAGASTPTEQPLTRREREVIEAAAAKERYRKLHEAGKTDEAKNDMARLALIRKERDEKAKQRAAELEEKKRIADAKAAASGKRR